jgi:hypothetical protein
MGLNLLVYTSMLPDSCLMACSSLRLSSSTAETRGGAGKGRRWRCQTLHDQQRQQ